MDVLMNLNAFSFRDIQNCMAILTVMEGMGIADIPAARLFLSEEIRRQAAASKPTYASVRPITCPDCQTKMIHGCMLEGLNRRVCPACGYSVIVGGIR